MIINYHKKIINWTDAYSKKTISSWYFPNEFQVIPWMFAYVCYLWLWNAVVLKTITPLWLSWFILMKGKAIIQSCMASSRTCYETHLKSLLTKTTLWLRGIWIKYGASKWSFLWFWKSWFLTKFSATRKWQILREQLCMGHIFLVLG